MTRECLQKNEGSRRERYTANSSQVGRLQAGEKRNRTARDNLRESRDQYGRVRSAAVSCQLCNLKDGRSGPICHLKKKGDEEHNEWRRWTQSVCCSRHDMHIHLSVILNVNSNPYYCAHSKQFTAGEGRDIPYAWTILKRVYVVEHNTNAKMNKSTFMRVRAEQLPRYCSRCNYTLFWWWQTSIRLAIGT